MNLKPHMLLRTGLIATSVALTLMGCAVGPNYAHPEPSLTAFHNGVVTTVQTQTATPIDRWWDSFADPMLTKVIGLAVDQNLDLTAAIARVTQARAAAAGAGAQLLPSASLDASAGYQRQSLEGAFGSIASGVPGFSRGLHEYSVGPAASWEIDLFGGLRRGAAAARAQAQAIEADRAAVQVSVAADAADAYLQIRAYQARLRVAQDQIDTDERLLRLVRDRYDAGSATGREIAQADALLKQARASIPPLRIGLERQLNRLDVLMGAQPGTYAQELVTVRDIPSVPEISADQSPTEMLRRRPDIIAAERRLAASNEQIGVALAGYYPKISLSGALGYNSISGDRLFTSSAFQAVGTGALRWRLFDFGRVDAEVAQARGANAEALALYRASVLHAAEDVENALFILSQTQLRVVAIEEQVNALMRARDLSEQAYRAGSITLTDVLDADRQLLSGRDELDANRGDAARAAVAVFRALGGGWDSRSTPDPST